MNGVADTQAAAELPAPSGWRRALPPFAVALAALALPFWDTGASLGHLWNTNGSYGHGILILPVSLYLIWLRRGEFEREAPRPSWLGVLAVAALMAAWLVSRVLGILMGEQLVLLAMLPAAIAALLGMRVATLAALPLLYLVCAIPIWSYLVPHLQVTTAVAATALARALGVPIYLEGLYMTIPDGQFLVAEVCSGLRYLLAALSLGGFYALLNLNSWWTRLLLVAASFVLGLVFNYVRVVGIVLAGHHSQMQSPLVHSHIGYGWVMFLLVIAGILLLGRLLERVDGPPAAWRGAAAQGRESPAAARFQFAAALVAGLALAPYGLAAAWMQPPGAVTLDLSALDAAGEWRRIPAGDLNWEPAYGGADASVLASFRGDGPRVDLFVAFYATQRQGAEAINEGHRVFDREVWSRYSLEAVPPRVAMGPDIAAEEFQIRRADGTGEQRLVWRSARVSGAWTVDALEAKRRQLAGLFTGRPSAAAVVLSTPLDGDLELARERLRRFVTAMLPRLEAALALAAASKEGEGAR